MQKRIPGEEVLALGRELNAAHQATCRGLSEGNGAPPRHRRIRPRRLRRDDLARSRVDERGGWNRDDEHEEQQSDGDAHENVYARRA
jgi:hypothetical protein